MYLRHQTYTLYYRDVCILVFMYLRIACYCDACLNSSAFACGSDDVTQYNTYYCLKAKGFDFRQKHPFIFANFEGK